MRRSSTILVVLALSLFLAACGDDGDFDAGDLRDILEVFRELEAESGAGGTGSGSSGNSGDSGDPAVSSETGANTDSPNRPPVPDGGVPEVSDHNGDGQNTEEWDFSPVDRSHDDVVEHYEDYFGSEGRSYTDTGGDPATRWDTPEQQVIVTDRGFSTTVTTRYND